MLNNRKAQALVISAIAVVFFLVLSAPLFDKVLTEKWALDRQRLEKETFYLAEGGLEEAINQFTSAIANFQIQPDVARYPQTGTIITAYSVSAALPQGARADSVINEAEPAMRQVLDPDSTAVGVKSYIVTTTCNNPQDPGISVTLNRAIALRVVYTFQHAIFYVDDMELIPGPAMNFSGRVHSNKDMYLSAESALTLNSQYVHSAGNIYNKRKDSAIVPPGTVNIRKLGTDEYPAMAGLDCDSPDWFSESQERWGGTVKSSVHGITNLASPIVGSIQPDGYYANMAGAAITNQTLKIGTRTLREGDDMPAGTILPDTDFYNNREGKFIRMTNIDLKKLAGYDQYDAEGHPSFPNNLPANGLLYVTRDDTPIHQEPGVRLVNASQIYRAGGLTVVTNDPIYIQGDYNTVNKKPTSVICDAVNILSNNWDDAKSQFSLSNRNAANTTVNTAFISGVAETTGGHYNGGVENYPRLHENWSGKTLQIRGAFVELWNSAIATGNWLYGAPQYTAPNRNWDYDTSFTVNNMPPFTPWAVEARRSAWWQD